jgi:hypothetical protein
MGNSDRKPLYGDAASIKEALSLITTYPDFYGLPPANRPLEPAFLTRVYVIDGLRDLWHMVS